MLYRFADSIRTFRPDSARKLSANLYDIYHCCVYSEKHLMMDRETVRNMHSFIRKINEKLVHLIGFILRNVYVCLFYVLYCIR